ncbi:nucleotidyltransferase family protein [Limnobacter sp.]|uniref:nucleotidyltransferase family protein n=1 Tax=Limnobacter sp. TaxID=2003368 RepID=UPI00311D8AD9
MISQTETQAWLKTVLPTDATVQQAIHSLESSSMQIVLVQSQDGRLFGTLTDGDIRRAFLRGLNLHSKICEIAHRNPLVAPPNMGRDLVLQLMQANRIHQLPVVDSDGRPLGLHVWDEILKPNILDNRMVIMAGGQGTRLRPHTENCPKPMLEVGGKPMLEHIIERAKADGFINFVISIHYLGEMIEDYFGDGTRLGVNIEYLRESSPLGTAGALSLMNVMPDAPFLVTNGDVMTDVHYSDILEFHSRHQAIATMAIRQHELQNPFGVVKTSGLDITGFEEKPIYRSHINAGIYALSPSALSCLNTGNHCDMPSLFSRLQANGLRTIAYPMHEPWLDVGRPDDLILAREMKH